MLDGAPVSQAALTGRHTLYVVRSGAVTLMNTAGCNAHHTSGCGSPRTNTATQPYASGVIYDQAADRIIVGGYDSTVSVLDPGAAVR